jgi:putative peptidoglycan lipid II flippase
MRVMDANADSSRTLVRSAGAMGIMTLLSRVLGYLRDLLLASILGAAGSSDAFIIALRIPNMLRRLVGEGALTAAFVPVFSRRLKEGGRQAAGELLGRALGTLSFVLVLLATAGVLLSPLVVRMVAFGFSRTAEKWDLTVALNRLMFPYLVFIGLAALAMGALNSLRSFAVPAFTPVLLNLSIITAALVWGRTMEQPAYAFAGGVLVGGFLQLAFQLPFLARRGMSLRPRLGFGDPHVRRIALLMVPGVFGVAVHQITVIVDAQFASFLVNGSVSWLYYADRVTELVLGVFAISVSTVVLPTLSRQVLDNDGERIRDTLSLALRLIAFITIPATIGLLLLRLPIITVLFQRGEFTSADAVSTSQALLGYCLGLLPFAAVKVLAPAFYAHQDTATPVKVAALSLLVHVGLCATLVGSFQHFGIALATSLSSGLNTVLLMWLLRRRLGADIWRREIFTGAAQFLVCGALMAGALWAFQRWLPFSDAGTQLAAAGWLAGAVTVGVVSYAAAHLILGGRELRELLALLPGRRGGAA